MKRSSGLRVLTWVIRLAVVAGFVLALVWEPGFGGQTTTDDAIVRDYEAVMDIDRAGNMELVEHLAVELARGKHGIFRIFDTADPRRPDVEHPVVVESVERDGLPEYYEEVGSVRGTYNIRIGKAEEPVEGGVYEYAIRSTTKDVFEPGDDDTTVWWWDIIGQGWQMPFDSVKVTAHLPATPTAAKCVRGEDTPCQVTVDDDTMTFQAQNLAPFEPVTVLLTFPADQLDPPAPAPPGGITLSLVLGIVLGLLVAVGGFLLVGRTREKPVGLPALFEPPEGIYPALGVKVLDEVESPFALQATLFDLAERGLLKLTGNDSGWTVKVVGDPSNTIMTAAEVGVLAKLGLDRPGVSFQLTKTEASGKTLSQARNALDAQVNVDSKPYLDRSPAGYSGTVLAWAAQIGFWFLVIRIFGGIRVNWLLLIPLAAASIVLAALLFDRTAWTVRNEAGRDMWSRVGGFSRFLTTDSAETRFDFAKRMDLYPRYLPWALVLGSADAWAQRYRDQGVEPPVVPWLVWTGSRQNFSMTSMTDSFNSVIAGAASAYAASQSSSGGGGFSGGSGGGGGGGGSW